MLEKGQRELANLVESAAQSSPADIVNPSLVFFATLYRSFLALEAGWKEIMKGSEIPVAVEVAFFARKLHSMADLLLALSSLAADTSAPKNLHVNAYLDKFISLSAHPLLSRVIEDSLAEWNPALGEVAEAEDENRTQCYSTLARLSVANAAFQREVKKCIDCKVAVQQCESIAASKAATCEQAAWINEWWNVRLPLPPHLQRPSRAGSLVMSIRAASSALSIARANLLDIEGRYTQQCMQIIEQLQHTGSSQLSLISQMQDLLLQRPMIVRTNDERFTELLGLAEAVAGLEDARWGQTALAMDAAFAHDVEALDAAMNALSRHMQNLSQIENEV